jgi:membrane protein
MATSSPSNGSQAHEAQAVAPGWWPLITQAGTQWSSHKDARLGAALAYYSVFSIGPLIVIAVAIAGLWFEHDAVRGEVSNGLRGLLGETFAKAIEGMLASASKPREGTLATIIGLTCPRWHSRR